MIRFLAKILIERYYDDAKVGATSDPLPHWLRQRVRGDAELQRFETELHQMENGLRANADAFVQQMEGSSQAAVSRPVELQENFGGRYRVAVAVLALAASLVVFAYVAQRFPSPPAGNSEIQITSVEIDTKKEQDPTEKKQSVQSLIDVSKRWASKMKSSRNKADKSLAFMRESLAEDLHSLESASRSSIRFVGQKIPAATVKMLGMNR